MKSKRQQLGLTLIELMMVASIIVVLMVVLMTYVFPSEDRQCRLEAERLASYLTRISAEALTSGSPARAVVDIPKSFVFRESTRETADFTQQLWQVGNRKLEHTVKEPVFVDSVDTESVADQKSGRAFVIFAGSKTEAPSSCSRGRHSIQWCTRNGEIRVEKVGPRLDVVYNDKTVIALYDRLQLDTDQERPCGGYATQCPSDAPCSANQPQRAESKEGG